MSVPVSSGLTYDDLWALPQDDGLRRELIDGELFVSPSPVRRHQRAVARITAALLAHVDGHGGEVQPAPADVYFSDRTVVEPDVVYVGAARVDQLTDERYVDIAPDLLVEVSSPATRRLDLVKKRALYERERVAEYWFVDLDADVVDVYRLDPDGHYGAPTTLGRGEVLTCLAAPGFELDVDRALGD
ncbi:MAG TPA: Uma2 family endonuclease [Egicoccus sp.]|nr:Uma2 family endonuclease [Egicoccus sp.]HSK21848.1 Uma2 family endonuclease [Egicoccus sp.]